MLAKAWAKTLGVTLFLGTMGGASAQENLAEQAGEVLSKRCLSCHNAEKKSGKLDLSTRKAAVAFGALVAKDAGKSRLFHRVAQGTMPPAGKLPAEEIATLRRWILAGATYPSAKLAHFDPMKKPLWSLQSLRRPAVPKSKYDALARNPIDRFIFATLEKNGLRPSAPAQRLALLRRVTVDLTGLLPTPEETAAFLADKSPNAYEKVVDRLLASPAYGERWGRHWLDVVRYGESHGYEQNHLRDRAYPYRDYVIRAFNEDIPYTRFMQEQLAGDRVGAGNPDREAATGFLVAGIHDTVGIQTDEGTRQQRANDLDDMVTTTGMTFLGLTIGCARCHDHKFDPIPTKDYYRLAAVFADVRHAERSLSPRAATPAQQQQLAELQRAIQRKTSEIERFDSEALVRRLPFGKALRPPVQPRLNMEQFAPVQAKFVRFTILATQDGAEPCLDDLQAFSPDSAVNLASSTHGGKATASSLLPGFEQHKIEHLNDGKFGNARSWISKEPGTGWAQVELKEPMRVDRVLWGRDMEGKFQDRLPTDYRIEVSLDGVTWRTVADASDRAIDPLRPTQALLSRLTAEQKARRAELGQELAALQKKSEALSLRQTAYVGNFVEPDAVYVLKRGDVMQRGELVSPGALSNVRTLSAELARERPGTNLAASSSSAPARLRFAEWLCDPRNPLPSRVMVNRLWAQHFGRGLSGTPSDFGNNGEKPSHPELLDWLANDFIANGWKMKRLHRMMVTSYVYRQASAARPEGVAKDANNRLLWRMPLRRMEAEAVRDSILQASGKLDRTMGGPGFRLYDYRIFNVAIYTEKEEQGQDTWRRAVYHQPARGIRDTLMTTLDSPECSERAAKRVTTTTALQALSLMNGRFLQQQSEFFAERVQREAQGVPAQIRRAFALTFGRAPTADEAQAAQQLLSAYGFPTLCRALLNANEFLYY